MRATRALVALLLVITGSLSLLLASTATPSSVAATQRADQRPVPRNFTGYGFDQCLAPTQRAMDAWLYHSPFWAVGIYISGKSRACRSQPNLTPTWIRTQIRKGWRLLPITLGPQASCSTRFPRYGNDPTIIPDQADDYGRARAQGRAEARDAVSVAKDLGLVAGSTLWYDLEGFDAGRTHCRESAIRFLSAWTNQLHRLGYVSGVYSSASSGIRMLDDVRVNRPGIATLPDRIWIADWNGRADVESTYIRKDGWKPGGRMHQYRGGHDETWGGVRINIDSNFIDLGTGSRPNYRRVFCGGVRMNFPRYLTVRPGDQGALVTALQCLMKQQGFYAGELTGTADAATVSAVRAVRKARGLADDAVAGRSVWMTLHSWGRAYFMKYGSAGESVRRLQRTLNTLFPESVGISGTYEARTTAAVKRYQRQLGRGQNGVTTLTLWRLMQAGGR